MEEEIVRGETPAVAKKMKISFSPTLTGERTDVAFVQSIPAFFSLPDPITYTALDLEEEMQAEGIRKAENFDMPILYTENQWDDLSAIADAKQDVYWFIQMPEETATEVGKPLTFYFKGRIGLGNDAFETENMIQITARVYKSSAVKFSKGYPTE